MANCSSSQKALRQNKKRYLINRMRRSRIKTFIKTSLNLTKSGSQDEARKALIKAQSEIMKGVTKGILKLNNASRKISKLTHKFKKIYPEL